MILNKLFGKYKFVTMSVILAVLILCLIFVIKFLYTDNSSVQKNEAPATSVSENTESSGEGLSGDSCFLVVCNDDNAGDIVFMFLADFRIYSSKIIITPLSVDTVSADGKSYRDVYAYGGINMLRECVENVRNISIDRYAITDRNGICSLSDLMGEINLDVKEDFTYQSSDKSYEVKTGATDMGADMLFTYLKFYSVRFGAEMFASLVCDIINIYLYEAETEDAGSLFSEVTNCFDTDVTISDYFSAREDINYLLEHNVQCVLVNDVD